VGQRLKVYVRSSFTEVNLHDSWSNYFSSYLIGLVCEKWKGNLGASRNSGAIHASRWNTASLLLIQFGKGVCYRSRNSRFNLGNGPEVVGFRIPFLLPWTELKILKTSASNIEVFSYRWSSYVGVYVSCSAVQKTSSPTNIIWYFLTSLNSAVQLHRGLLKPKAGKLKLRVSLLFCKPVECTVRKNNLAYN